MGKIMQSKTGLFETALLTDNELGNLQTAIFMSAQRRLDEGNIAYDSLYVSIIKLEEMHFFRSYCNQFSGYWIQVQIQAKPDEIHNQIPRYITFVAMSVDDGWFVEFAWDTFPTHYPDDSEE